MSKNYGLILRKFRIAKNLSQNQLSKKAGLTSSCINQLEANLRTYSQSSLLALSTALEITPNDLLGFKNKVLDEQKIELYKVYKSSAGLGYGEYCLLMPIKIDNDNYVCIVLELPNKTDLVVFYDRILLSFDTYQAYELKPTNINPKSLDVYKNNTLFTYFYDNLGDKIND